MRQIGPLLAGFVAGVGVLLVGFFVYARWRQGQVRWALVVRQIGALDAGWLAAAASLALGSYVVRALRWNVMLSAVKAHARFGSVLSATAIGSTAVLLLGRAGEPIRPYLIARKEGVSVSSQVAAWLVERVYDLLATLLFLGYALGQWRQAGSGWLQEAMRAAGLAMLVGACAGMAVLAAMALRPDWVVRRTLGAAKELPAGAKSSLEKWVRGFLEGLTSVRTLRDQLRLVGYTVLEWAVIAGGCWCFFRSSHWTAGFGLREVLIFLGVVSAGSVLQAPGIGGGVQLAATVVLTELHAVPVEASLGLAVTLWAITFVVVVPFGLLFSLREGVNWITIKVASERESS